MEREGARRVPVMGATDKRQITAVFCGTAVGEFLPIQLIYPGKTKRCHPQYDFPLDWHITQSPKHWSNELNYLHAIRVPYLTRVRESLGVSPEHPALFDHFKGQMTSKVLEANHIHSVLIPESCTDKLQPMDVSVNKAAKAFLHREFQSWYANSIMTQKGEFCPVDLTTVAMKHIGAKWLVKMFEHISNNPHLVVNGFIASGITKNISDAIETVHKNGTDMVELSSEDEDEYDTDCEATFSSLEED